jgi:predicted O-linked N-acetylglucosamine transferase (SPINDLY family)
LGLEGEGPLFVCPGVPFKYRPDDDRIFVDIARRLGRCTFVFFRHDIPELSHKLHRRIAMAFEAAGLDPKRYLRVTPWLPRNAFFGLLLQADVYLDTLGFSGFNTMMQAVECHLPCVTYEGRFMRGRLGSGILRRIGLPECIAANRAQYIDLAVKLGLDAVHRAGVRETMQTAKMVAYADMGAVDALAQVLFEARDA